MTDLATAPSTSVEPIPGGPYDIEFFFDPGCPFAWQTSVWIRRVQELRGTTVGWRFISLHYINGKREGVSADYLKGSIPGLRFHRICAAARAEFGNDAVARLYQAYGTRYWNTTDGDGDERRVKARANADPAAILTELDLPASLLAAADDESWDDVLHAESDEAFRRTGDGVGTPIITYGEGGNSLFGPVISSVPDDDTALAFFDALQVVVAVPSFSELKRSNRAPLDLPLVSAGARRKPGWQCPDRA